MNIDEVPQDKKNFLDGNKAPKKVMYVTSKDGKMDAQPIQQFLLNRF